MILDAIDEEIIIHVTSLIGQKTHSKRLPRCQLFALVWEPRRKGCSCWPSHWGFEGASLGSGGYESVSPRSRRARSRGRFPSIQQCGGWDSWEWPPFIWMGKHYWSPLLDRYRKTSNIVRIFVAPRPFLKNGSQVHLWKVKTVQRVPRALDRDEILFIHGSINIYKPYV